MTFEELIDALPKSPEDYATVWTTGKAICVETDSAADAAAELLEAVFPGMEFGIVYWHNDKNYWEDEHEELSGGSDACVGWYGVY